MIGKKFFINNFLFLNWNYFNILIVLVKEVFTYKFIMSSWLNYSSFYKLIFNNFCYYYSRSRNFLWLKGENSKNFQILKNFSFDCDMDIIFFNVIQYYKISCHTNYFFCNFNKIL